MNHTYHNTNEITGRQLFEYVTHTQNQDAAVLRFFQSQPVGTSMSPRSVWKIGFPDLELTSVRRAISNLTRDGKLVKTDIQLPGDRGRPEYLWRLPVGQMGLL